MSHLIEAAVARMSAATCGRGARGDRTRISLRSSGLRLLAVRCKYCFASLYPSVEYRGETRLAMFNGDGTILRTLACQSLRRG